jgi:hypothetical protein
MVCGKGLFLCMQGILYGPLLGPFPGRGTDQMEREAMATSCLLTSLSKDFDGRTCCTGFCQPSEQLYYLS